MYYENRASVKRLFQVFGLCFVLLCLSFLLSYFYYSSDFFAVSSENAEFLLSSKTDAKNTVRQAVLFSIPTVAQLILSAVSVFTSYNFFISAALTVTRGLAIGGYTALMSADKLIGLENNGGFGLMLYFAATVLMLLFFALTALYSDAGFKAKVLKKRRFMTEMKLDFIKNSLVLGGLILLISGAAVILI